MSLIHQVVTDYCKGKNIMRHVDALEKDVRFARDMHPSKPLNNTVASLLSRYKEQLRKEGLKLL